MAKVIYDKSTSIALLPIALLHVHHIYIYIYIYIWIACKSAIGRSAILVLLSYMTFAI